VPPEPPSINLTSFKPGKDNVRGLGDGILTIRLAPGEVSDFLDLECPSTDIISDWLSLASLRSPFRRAK